MIDGVGIKRGRAIQPLIVALVEFNVLAQWIDQPVFAHAGGLVFDKFITAVAANALRRDNLNDQISRAVEECRLDEVHALFYDKQNIRLAPAWMNDSSHQEGGD